MPKWNCEQCGDVFGRSGLKKYRFCSHKCSAKWRQAHPKINGDRRPFLEQSTGQWLVPLTRGLLAIIDAEDSEAIDGFNWRADPSRNTFYASRHGRDGAGNKIKVYMHQAVAEKHGLPVVDHKNRNGLDNRKSNLRPCSYSFNGANSPTKCGSSKFRGVSWSSKDRVWRSQITVNYRHRNIGSFNSERDAAMAYDEAAKEAFGDFAALNFMDAK